MSGARVVPTHDHDRQTANGGGGGDGDSGGNAPPQRHSNLYVCGLPTGFTSRDVTALFEPHGQVESARVMQKGNQLSCAACVKMATVEDAERAAERLTGAVVQGHRVTVQPARHNISSRSAPSEAPPSENVYCKNLPFGFHRSNLLQLFRSFGRVLDCRVLYQGTPSGHGGAALVRFQNVDEAAAAVHQLQGHCVVGASVPLIIRFADSHDMKLKKRSSQHSSQSGSGPPPPPAAPHLHHAAEAAHQAAYDREARPAGAAPQAPSHAAAALPRASSSSMVEERHPPRPSVHPAHSVAGVPAKTRMPAGLGPSTPHVHAGPSTPHVRTGPSTPHVHARPSIPHVHAGRPHSVSTQYVASVYVANLPADADRLLLYELFAPFGAILSVRILTEPQGGSRGIGFVNFRDLEAASSAISALDSSVFRDRQLHVALQHRKPVHTSDQGA